ncbi:uncharacterized protein [Argopecten irradians]
MPSYKLHYFPIRARGELIRLLFAAAGKTFTDQHITFADWPSKKPEMPTGQLPVLEIDGEKLSQSLTIARYLSREFGLAGDNSLDQARADQVTDTISDLLGEFFKYAFEKDAAKKEEIKTKLFDSVLPTFATNVTKFLDMNKTKSGYFVGKKLTVADLAVYEGFEDFLLVDPKSLDKHPKLVAHRKLVLTNPKVKAYLDKRPKTDVIGLSQGHLNSCTIRLNSPVDRHPAQRLTAIHSHKMPSYKLIYFTVRGRGELIRLAFAASGQSYDEEKVTFETWPALKPKMPTKQLPVLEVDGKQLTQSLAIARYLGREFGLAGEGNMDQFLVDQVIDTGADALTAYVKWYFEKEETKKAELKKELVDTTIPKFAEILTNYLENSGGKNGFFVGSKLSLADLACHETFTDFLQLNPDCLKDYPKLAANRQKVEENANVKQYLSSRPESVI